GSFAVPERRVRDWQRHPELVWLDRFDWLPFIALLVGLYSFGEWAAIARPDWQTNGAQMLVWGGAVSTVLLYHATYTINSLAHRFGHRRFDTADESRNNVWLALLTLGEGWHNNHHRYPLSARQGFYWWQLDLSYLGLRALKALGVISDIRPVPRTILEEGRCP
ncbi:MAG: fatty acid desaturase, partial [Gammaproteobacteria bacterium]